MPLAVVGRSANPDDSVSHDTGSDSIVHEVLALLAHELDAVARHE